MRVTLIRVAQSEAGTFGVLVHDFIAFALTLELPRRGNQHDVSCIPAGTYPCEPWHSPSKGDVIRILSVPGRDNILIHKGNTEADSLGCILVGEAFEPIHGHDGIAYSAQGFGELLTWAAGQPFELDIVDPPDSTRQAPTTEA